MVSAVVSKYFCCSPGGNSSISQCFLHKSCSFIWSRYFTLFQQTFQNTHAATVRRGQPPWMPRYAIVQHIFIIARYYGPSIFLLRQTRIAQCQAFSTGIKSILFLSWPLMWFRRVSHFFLESLSHLAKLLSQKKFSFSKHAL